MEGIPQVIQDFVGKHRCRLIPKIRPIQSKGRRLCTFCRGIVGPGQYLLYGLILDECPHFYGAKRVLMSQKLQFCSKCAPKISELYHKTLTTNQIDTILSDFYQILRIPCGQSRYRILLNTETRLTRAP